jgi:hypothetical protein
LQDFCFSILAAYGASPQRERREVTFRRYSRPLSQIVPQTNRKFFSSLLQHKTFVAVSQKWADKPQLVSGSVIFACAKPV